jgi:putative lipoic acid-binding regulatory protein
MSITAMITAESKAQLDKIYLALNNHPLVKITL